MKATFELIQHTPIIHFQHSQAGATIRPSELKPRLDRFLQGRIDPDLFSEQKSLDYKVRIIADGKSVATIPGHHPLFFGNTGDIPREKRKEFVTSNNVTVTFFSFNKNIISAVEKHFEAFLANTNFGTRQSKGFGSFSIKDRNFQANLIIKNNPAKSKIFKFHTNAPPHGDIGLLYSMLRSGINHRFYGKSLLFLYAKTKKFTWDKRAIKRNFFGAQLAAQTREHPGSDALTYNSGNEYLMRDLLGLSCDQEWGSYGVKITKEHVPKPDKKIERFPSPLIFKPIKVDNGYDIYFWARPMTGNILDETFRIFKIINNEKRKDFKIKTPKKFEIDDFLCFCFDPVSGVDIPAHLAPHSNRNLEYIFRKIRNNL